MEPLSIGGVLTQGTAEGKGTLVGGAALSERQGDFAAIISRAQGRAGNGPEAAREAAQQFVAVALVQPLLAQLRATNQAAAPFAPSNAEKQFRGMMDAQRSQEMVRAANFPVVDAVARSLMRAASGRKGPGEGKEWYAVDGDGAGPRGGMVALAPPAGPIAVKEPERERVLPISRRDER